MLTGAGISVASGLPTYRGPGGLWNQGETATWNRAEALAEDPEGQWRFFHRLGERARAASPNAAHLALAAWEARLQARGRFTLITQNLDDLHRRAGSQEVIELHGTLRQVRCADDGCPQPPLAPGGPAGPPPCPRCGGPLRPDVVLFGEPLPAHPEHRAKQALRRLDLFLAVGTSGLVDPAARFVRAARYAGATTALVNLEAPSGDAHGFDVVLTGPAEELLPRLLECV